MHAKSASMNKNLLSRLLCVIAAMILSSHVQGQTTLIHYWHFNNFNWSDTLPNAVVAPTITNPGIYGIEADYSTLDTSKAKILYMLQPGVSSSWPDTTFYHVGFTYIDNYGGSAVNARMAADSGFGLRTRNPSDSMELRFYIPTTHYKNIVVSFSCERSGSGMLVQHYDYSSDSGATWGSTGLSITSDSIQTSYTLHTISLASAYGTQGNPRLVFRVRFEGNDNTHNGNNRWDNVTVEGDTLTVPAGINPITNEPVYSLYPNPANTTLEVNGGAAGEKSVVVYNMVGQKVLTGNYDSDHFSLNTSALASGLYYINIQASSSGDITTMKFIKQ